MAATKTRATGHASKVLAHLVAHRGQELYTGDIAADVGLAQSEVSSALSNLRRNYDIAKPSKGWCLYRGPKKEKEEGVAIGADAKVAGLMADGRLLIEVEGRFGVWKEIDV